MTEISMNKAIHGAFRRDLNRFVTALSSFPAGDRTRAQQLNTAWANFDDQLTFHHEGEHEIAWPTLAGMGFNKDILDTMDAEHEKMAAALAAVGPAMQALELSADTDAALNALTELQKLQNATLHHLDHEEAAIESFYMDNRESRELKEMGRKFGQVNPARAGRFFTWLLDGAGPDERRAIKRDVPGPVLTLIGGIFGRGYRKNIAPVWRG